MKKYIKHKGRPTLCQLGVGEPETAGSGERGREGGNLAGKQEARMVGFYSVGILYTRYTLYTYVE